jgi:hypothetical protein
MAIARIGGVDYNIQELNFIAIERAWPFIEEAMITADPMKGPAAGIRIVAAGIMEQENFDQTKFDIPAEEQNPTTIFDAVTYFLKKKLKATEISAIKDCVIKITEEAGLVGEEGEDKGAMEPLPTSNLSTGTAPDTLPNSSQPDAREAVGTA